MGKTRRQNLVRHKPGRYYVRLYINGNEIWKSLKTSHFSVAESKLASLKKEHKQQQAHVIDAANANLILAKAAELHIQRLDQKVSIKSKTRLYWKQRLAALLKHWEGLAKTEVRKITPTACRAWAASFAECSEPSTFNNTVSLLKHVFELAIENGVIYADPAAGLERKPIRG